MFLRDEVLTVISMQALTTNHIPTDPACHSYVCYVFGAAMETADRQTGRMYLAEDKG